MKVSDLSGVLLDYWVAEAQGMLRMVEGTMEHRLGGYSPSSQWRTGGPIIEREKMMICQEGDGWGASPPNGCWNPSEYSAREMGVENGYGYGPTPLAAAMRAYVHSKFGDTVPDLDEKSITKDGMHRI
jgi:hypothetical protein